MFWEVICEQRHYLFQVSHPHCVVQNCKYKQYTVKHNSINDCIKVYFLHCFVQRHVSALVMSHLQVDCIFLFFYLIFASLLFLSFLFFSLLFFSFPFPFFSSLFSSFSFLFLSFLFSSLLLFSFPFFSVSFFLFFLLFSSLLFFSFLLALQPTVGLYFVAL